MSSELELSDDEINTDIDVLYEKMKEANIRIKAQKKTIKDEFE